MDVNLKLRGKHVKANVTFTNTLTIDYKVVDFHESQISEHFKLTHIGFCGFKGDMFSAFVPDNEHYTHELVILYGIINHIYSNKSMIKVMSPGFVGTISAL